MLVERSDSSTVEQGTHNLAVEGSNPSPITKIEEVAVGMNPALAVGDSGSTPDASANERLGFAKRRAMDLLGGLI